jgi:two-component system chemotaxis response regulator CheB
MKKILVVDDSALMRRVIFDIINTDEELHAERYAVNGLDALEILQSGEKFDAIVLDINMPKMNGIEFLRELKMRGMNEKVLIVSTLAREGAKETIQALELGAFDFVTKPDSLAEAKGPSFSKRLIGMIHAATNLSTADVSDDEKQTVQKTERNQKVLVRERIPFTKKVLKGDISKHSKKPMGEKARKIVALACSTDRRHYSM